ncbi:MAG: hypothetical protein ACR2GY_01370 [Phycisphaerales bacterium]
MKKTVLWSMIAVLMAVMLVPQAYAGTDHHCRRAILSGVIAEVGHDSIVLIVQRGDERHRVRIAVVDRTRIKLNGEEAHLGDLQHGDHARVRVLICRTRDGIRIVATHIAAFRRE